MKFQVILAILLFSLGAEQAFAASSILVGTTSENFTSIGSGLPAGWSVRTGATSTSRGTAQAFSTGSTTWGVSSGSFKNYAAATGFSESESTVNQNASSDRALGIRQTELFGDSGASFDYIFGTAERVVTEIRLDLMMLDVEARSTAWSIQYGLGVNPMSFITLGTYSDPGVFGTTTRTFTGADFGMSLDDQEDVIFRVVALNTSVNSGSRDSFAIDNFSITAVPEPSSILLVPGGILLFFRRTRK